MPKKSSRVRSITRRRGHGVFRDYTSLAWFEEPRRTGQRGITGPYVDYLCTDQYTLTFTAPLMSEGRVVACTSGPWVTGDLIRELGPGRGSATGWQVTDCPGTPFVVATAD